MWTNDTLIEVLEIFAFPNMSNLFLLPYFPAWPDKLDPPKSWSVNDLPEDKKELYLASFEAIDFDKKGYISM